MKEIDALLRERIAKIAAALGLAPAEADRLLRAVRVGLWRDPAWRALVKEATGHPPPRPSVAPTARPRELLARDVAANEEGDDGDDSHEAWEIPLRRRRMHVRPGRAR